MAGVSRDRETSLPGPDSKAGGIDLMLAGNLLVDDVVFRDGRTRFGEAGGAMLYAALGASLWGVRVGVVSVVGIDYPAAALAALESHGIDLRGVRRLDGPGLRTWLLYEDHGRQVVHQRGRPTHVEVSPAPGQIPDDYASARAVHLAPMPLACQRELVRHLAHRPGLLLSLDPHEPVTEDCLADWLEILADADGFFPGEDELAWRRWGSDPLTILRRLQTRRLKWVALKRGAGGGLLCELPSGRGRPWSAIDGAAVDCTGAGDAFAGGFIAGLLAGGDLESALQQGQISASFAIEDWGPRGLLAASPERAAERRHQRLGSRSRS